MKKRILATLTAVMLICSSATCIAVEPRASHYFDGYILGVAPHGNCQMSVSFSVLGTDYMDKIGAYSIRIEEEFSTNNWVTSFTVYGDDDPDVFYGYNIFDHTGSFTFTGIPDVKYRAVMVAYAENASGHEYSDEFVCTGRVCK